jgi:hypothetical protein
MSLFSGLAWIVHFGRGVTRRLGAEAVPAPAAAIDESAKAYFEGDQPDASRNSR